MSDAHDHPSSVQIVAYAADRLPTRESEFVHRHCLVCEECGARLQALICLRWSSRQPVPTAVRWSRPFVAGGLPQ